jgi:hypothetical protein
MKGSALVGLLIVAVVAFAAGWYLHQQPGPVSTAGGGQHPTATPTVAKVVIAMKSDNSCAQLNSQGGFAKVPPLSVTGGDSITWVKGIDAKGNEAPLVVTFPPMSNTHVGTPFVDGSGNPKLEFHNGDNSGPAPKGTPYDTYLYLSATVGGVACTNPQDPGVIITE